MPDETATTKTDPAAWRAWLGARSGPALFVLALAGFFVLSTAALTLGRLAPSRADTRQPIAFNHRKHVEENAMECSECHEFYAAETFSGLPAADLCGFCHAEAQGESAEEARLVRLLEEGAPLDWKPLFRQPPHVYYSHRRHVGAGVECETCHGAFAASEAPPARVEILTMDECVDCHRREGASEECTACHR